MKVPGESQSGGKGVPGDGTVVCCWVLQARTHAWEGDRSSARTEKKRDHTREIKHSQKMLIKDKPGPQPARASARTPWSVTPHLRPASVVFFSLLHESRERKTTVAGASNRKQPHPEKRREEENRGGEEKSDREERMHKRMRKRREQDKGRDTIF